MAITALVVFWIVVGLSVFLLAMRGGRRARKDSTDSGRGSTRVAWIVTAIMALVFGVALPAYAIIDDGKEIEQAPGGVDLTSSQVEARQMFATSCGQCHTLHATRSVGKVGPNLDVLRPNKALTLDAIKAGRARGNGQMPAEVLQGTDAEDVASFVAAVAGR